MDGLRLETAIALAMATMAIFVLALMVYRDRRKIFGYPKMAVKNKPKKLVG